jgi:hypothetical protein
MNILILGISKFLDIHQIRKLTFIYFLAFFANHCWAVDEAVQSWVMGNNAASFTYTGSQSGIQSGTVFTLSTAGTSLGFCTLTPNNGSSGYSPSCFTGYGTILNGGSNYTAVAYLGSVNNPNSSFAAGDSNGNIYILTPIFSPAIQGGSSYVVQGLRSEVVGACPSNNSVSNIAADPQGGYLYVGCYNPTPYQVIVYPEGQSTLKDIYTLPGYTLYSIPITATGTVGQISTVFNRGVFGVFAQSNNSSVNNQLGVWPGISPAMRTYPPGYPGLQIPTAPYASSGGVMVSGLVNNVGVGSDSANTNTGPLDVNFAVYMCSKGTCNNINEFSSYNSSGPQVYTAYEIGMDTFNGASQAVPSIYSNTLNGSWTCLSYSPTSGQCYEYGGTIYWKQTPNTISSCPIDLMSYGGISCSGGSYNLLWVPDGIPAAGNGYQIDITNLTYVPTPQNNASPFTQGLLMIGTWTNGYLSYHSPANPNGSTSYFLQQVNSGQVGNINALTYDANGNLMFQTGSQGLYVMNPFVGTNTATGTDITLIQQSSDAGNGNPTLKNGAGILFNAVDFLEALTETSATTALTAMASPERLPHNLSGAVGLTPRYSLGRPFGKSDYRAQFVFTEAQLLSLGLKPNSTILGMRLRNAEGFSDKPSAKLHFNNLQVALSQNPANESVDDLNPIFLANIGKKRQVVRQGPFDLYKNGLPSTDVHPDTVGSGSFGQAIRFQKSYRYEGGNLVIEMTSSGSKRQIPLLVDAFGTKAIQGMFKSTTTKGSVPVRAVPAIEFILK